VSHFKHWQHKVLGLILLAVVASGVLAAPAHAYDFTRPLAEGDTGDDVAALQMRIAGWLARADQRRLRLSGTFDGKTKNALISFQKHYGLDADGIAGQATFDVLASLEDPDGSTVHFEWTEFVQNHNSRCSDAANKYAGTFKGGKVPRETVRRNVQRLMWRLEALRAKGGDKPIGINSGFRSVAYNDCIGGASLSQHLYGTAVDMRVSDGDNRETRDHARHSQFQGIGCYSGFTHNHLDLRLDNAELPEAHYWWWPEQNSKGHDLAEDGKACWGETTEQKRAASAFLIAVRAATPGVGSYIPSLTEVTAFKGAGEPMFHGLGD